MSDRRGNKKFRLTETVEGTVRMYPDLIVEPHGDDEWIAIGREGAVVGETLILDMVLLDPEKGGHRSRLAVCVIESHPIFLDGDLHHLVRLCRSTPAAVVIEQRGKRG
jgi:hypothetical protein